MLAGVVRCLAGCCLVGLAGGLGWVRPTMEPWTETQQKIGALRKARENVLRVLEIRFGPAPATVTVRMRAMENEAALDALYVRVLTATTLEETGPLSALLFRLASPHAISPCRMPPTGRTV